MKIKLFLVVIMLCFWGLVNAKNKDSGLEITDSVQLVVNQVFIGGNKKTKERIIARELLVERGDTIYEEHLDYFIEKSKENLLNTSLFNYITINTIKEQPNKINLYVIVEERWYLWPYLILEHADRNFSSFLHNHDWTRINYGLMMVKNNFRGRGETIKFKVRLGYKEQFQLAYQIPYLGQNRKHGIATDINWNRLNEMSYLTDFDKPVYFKDNNDYVNTAFNYQLTYTFRNKHYITHSLTGAYSFNRVEDTIIQLNENYFGNNSNKIEYLSLFYAFNLDKRNYRIYPLSGHNIEVRLAQYGLGLFHDELNSIWEVETSAYQYWELANRWHSGIGSKLKVSTNKKQPYFIEQALGYRTFLRSFEYYVIDGQSYATTRSFFKYTLVPTQVRYVEGWNWSKFNKIHYSLYINSFVDLGYVYDVSPYQTNELSNTFLASTGIGIDMVAYYDQVLRFEYSINRFGEHGFFIHIGKAF